MMEKEIIETKIFSIMFLLLTALPSMGQVDDFNSTTGKVWHGGVVSHQLAFDSITVEETYGPIVPGRTVAAIMYIYDNVIGKGRKILTINGVETPLPMPDDAGDFSPSYIGYGNGNLYVVGQRIIKNDELPFWVMNYEYAVWKNMEFQYIINDSRLIDNFGVDVCVDGDDLYLWGYGYLSLQEDSNGDEARTFYFKNNELAYVYEHSARGFDVENGDVYIATDVRLYDSYHSTSSAWTDWGQVTQLRKNGTTNNLQRVDRSKLFYTEGMVVRNGVVHIVGFTDLLGGNFNGKTERLFSAWYYDGNSNHEDPYYYPYYCINIDDNGNVYIVSHRKELDNQKPAFVLLKNGVELYELSDGDPYWGTSYSFGGKLPRIFFDGDDIFVLACGYHIDAEDEYHNSYMVWKNDQLIWKSDDGYPAIYKMIIY